MPMPQTETVRQNYSLLFQETANLQSKLEAMISFSMEIGDHGVRKLLQEMMEKNTMLATHIKSQADV